MTLSGESAIAPGGWTLIIEWCDQGMPYTQRYECHPSQTVLVQAVDAALAELTRAGRGGEYRDIRELLAVPTRRLRAVPVRRRDMPTWERDR